MEKSVNATPFEKIPALVEDEKDVVNAVIETPRDQRHKYALEPKYGIFRQKLLLPKGLSWPYDYGFIPRTKGDDGDPLDILYLGAEPTFTGCLVQARIVGIINLKKNGVENDRILGCPMPQDGLTQDTDAYKDVDDVPKDTMKSICRYLVEYSEAEGNKIEFLGAQSREHVCAAQENICRECALSLAFQRRPRRAFVTACGPRDCRRDDRRSRELRA